MRTITVAQNAGFCFGVKNAVETAEKMVNEYKGHQLVMLGELTHNSLVVDSLVKKGFTIANNASEVKENSVVIIRAHGVTPSELEILKTKNCTIIDCTCPFVSKIHKIVREQSEAGKNVIVVGTKGHPEVVGICGEVKNSKVEVISSIDELDDLKVQVTNSIIVSQTTFSKETFDKIVRFIKNKFANVTFFDTICNTTCNRQREAEELADKSDVMLVIGSSHSSNTKKLFDICSSRLSETYLLENIDMLDELISSGKLSSDARIGITAGASTPEIILLEVVRKMSENEIDFGSFIESIPQLRRNAVVKGAITSADGDYVYVDVRDKSEGRIPRDEFANDVDFDLDAAIAEKREIEVQVKSIRNTEYGKEIILSKQALEMSKNKAIVEEAFNAKTPVVVKIVRSTKKKDGLIGIYSGIEVYIHKTQIDLRPVSEDAIDSYVGKELTVLLTRFEEQDRRLKVSGSARTLLSEELKAKKAATLSVLQIGNTIKGKVKNFASFGAFIDIGGFEALLPNKFASWERNAKASDVMKEGDEIEVTVIDISDIEASRPKITLSLRKDEDNPYYNIEERIPVGSIVMGKVVRIIDWAAFIELEPGVDAQCHVSAISNVRIATPADVLKEGMEVKAKVLEIKEGKNDSKKILVSIKAVEPIDPENDEFYVPETAEEAAEETTEA
ncbi:MAG: 4-hydroxy-3-methylbut-2-enyl diphosphate reductase [Clostridia bacterium]|nr:4-hydroxy-3-methylbut-2-enyl diphosphate reductase [Clostridia bacterium]